jgi:hypothetical protein
MSCPFERLRRTSVTTVSRSGLMASRAEVFAAIDGERAYQQTRWNEKTTTSKGEHSLSEWIAYMEDYLREAKQILAREARQNAYPKVLPIMRKVVTMGVAAMEQHGAPQREGFSPLK